MASDLDRALALTGPQKLWVRQRFEALEFLGFETRNKYEVQSENGISLAFAAEQQKGFFSFFLRQYLGHWRSFEILFFTSDRQVYLTARHPFRWFFKRIEVKDASGQLIGAIQKRFAFFSKKFDVEDAMGNPLMAVSSPLWRIWSFRFRKEGRPVGQVAKKWGGLFAEGFSDKDRFLVEYTDPTLSKPERTLILTAAIFIDLMYFEKKA